MRAFSFLIHHLCFQIIRVFVSNSICVFGYRYPIICNNKDKATSSSAQENEIDIIRTECRFLSTKKQNLEGIGFDNFKQLNQVINLQFLKNSIFYGTHRILFKI